MNHTRNQLQPHRRPVAPEIAAELEGAIVVERPDGYWLQPAPGGHEMGPYATLVEAIEDYRAAEDGDDLESEDTLAEVEAQIGVADWIDPETSAPAEDGVPHLEDH